MMREPEDFFLEAIEELGRVPSEIDERQNQRIKSLEQLLKKQQAQINGLKKKLEAKGSAVSKSAVQGSHKAGRSLKSSAKKGIGRSSRAKRREQLSPNSPAEQ